MGFDRLMQKLTLFYDGLCPLCEAEIIFLSRRNQAGLLDFVDINSTDFASQKTELSCEAALAEMYGQYADGQLIKGVEVFSESYKRANLRVLAWIFSRTTLRPFFNLGYRIFAKNRHTISKWIGPTLRKIVG
jgi:predicted DCC family thiol-disulfide oxidoreductase YuxK